MSSSRSSSSAPASAARARACSSIAGEVSIPTTGPAGLARDWDRDAAVSDAKLDEQSVGFARELDVERHVLGHVGRPLLVLEREPFRPAHPAMLGQSPGWPP